MLNMAVFQKNIFLNLTLSYFANGRDIIAYILLDMIKPASHLVSSQEKTHAATKRCA